VPRAPLHERGVTSRIVVSGPRQQVLPCVIARTGSCVGPQPSPCLRITLGQRVCAGCCQPRLGGGPSRRYLCVSFPACLDLYPGGSCGAHTRFFPHDSGLPRVRTGSALHNVRTATSVRRVFRGCSHSLMFRPTGLLATPVAPTDISLCGSRGFSVRASHGLLPPRAPDMLTVRIGQLTVWGLSPHQIRSLVGCSPNGLRLSGRAFQRSASAAC